VYRAIWTVTLDLKLPKRKKIDLEGIAVGLTHGEVYPRGDSQQLRYIGLEMGVEVLITGHTHWAFIEELPDMLLLNPGSPTVPGFQIHQL
jgi:putative phosphoesterase